MHLSVFCMFITYLFQFLDLGLSLHKNCPFIYIHGILCLAYTQESSFFIFVTANKAYFLWQFNSENIFISPLRNVRQYLIWRCGISGNLDCHLNWTRTSIYYDYTAARRIRFQPYQSHVGLPYICKSRYRGWSGAKGGEFQGDSI